MLGQPKIYPLVSLKFCSAASYPPVKIVSKAQTFSKLQSVTFHFKKKRNKKIFFSIHTTNLYSFFGGCHSTITDIFRRNEAPDSVIKASFDSYCLSGTSFRIKMCPNLNIQEYATRFISNSELDKYGMKYFKCFHQF